MSTKTRPADLYRPRPTEPELVDVPKMQFLMVDGRGDPNTSVEYRQAVEALFGTAYGLKFLLKKKGHDFKVAPLEGLWWAPDLRSFEVGRKADWQWTAMIKQPDEVTPQDFASVRDELKRKKPSPAIEKLRLATFDEGPAAQIMHIGPYSAEGPTIARLHAFIRDRGYRFDGKKQKHHEIYLGDPRRAAPDKLKTVIRQPFSEWRKAIPVDHRDEHAPDDLDGRTGAARHVPRCVQQPDGKSAYESATACSDGRAGDHVLHRPCSAFRQLGRCRVPSA